MDNRPPYFGIGTSYAPAPLSQYLGEETRGNNSSSSSHGSILTQIPLPYHSSGGYEQQTGFFNTPEMSVNSAAAFQPFSLGQNLRRSTNTPLNPTSAPYIPPASSYLGAFEHQVPPRGPYGLQPPPAVQQNNQGQYAAGRQYYGVDFAPTDGLVNEPEFGSRPYQPDYQAQFNAPLQGPYGPYGEYLAPPYGPTPGVNSYPQGYRQGPPPGSYPQVPSFVSPTASYTTYTTGPGSTVTVSTYGASQPQRASVLPQNANRGKTAVKYSQGSQGFQAGGAKMSGQTKSGSQNKYGGPVLPPPSTKNSGESKSKRTSLASSSQTLQLTSQTGYTPTSQDSGHSDLGSPTPLPKKARKDVSFASDLRLTKTPILRSRRGQSIQASATDPTSKTTVDWLSKIPDRPPPPKMMSLLTNQINQHEASKLKSPEEADPFTASTPRRVVGGNAASQPPLLNNPFAAHQLTVNNRMLRPDQGMSPALRALTNNGRSRPTVEQVLDTRNLPFVEYCRIKHVKNSFGVIKLSNIPYSVNRSEVMAFLGRNARIISEHDYEPIHIVMERVTSKTLDCYVEFVNVSEAIAAVGRFESNRTAGRNGRLGQRHVEMELSSQDDLQRDLFPKAKNVMWEDGNAFVIPTDPNDKYNSGFQGFVSNEEMVMLLKHVESPQRSPFSKECPQRPYECMISTLLKYPWHMVDFITIEDRNLLYDCTIKMLDNLRDRLDGRTGEQIEVNITAMLWKRLWRAALKCPGFSPTMKDEVVFKNFVNEDIAQEYGVPLFAADWKYVWTIGPKPGAPHDLILWYAAIIREFTTSQVRELSLAQKAAQGGVQEGPKLFGNLERYFGHPKNFEEFQHLTLAQVAINEWAGLENILRQAFAPRLEGVRAT